MYVWNMYTLYIVYQKNISVSVYSNKYGLPTIAHTHTYHVQYTCDFRLFLRWLHRGPPVRLGRELSLERSLTREMVSHIASLW